MSQSSSTRRGFLRSTAALAAGSAVAPYWFTGEHARADESKSKNDRPHIAQIGCGGQGTRVTELAARFGDVVAVCDVDLKHAEHVKTQHGGKATIYRDYRRLLDRKDIDVVINGTPDHWHTAINIATCKSGKDLYTEKPLTLTIDEGKLLCKVVEETGRIVQVGTQSRSFKPFQTAVELVRNGRLGKLKQVWVALPYYATSGGPFAKQPVPSDLDWDTYQGQAPLHEYCPERTHINFRWWYEYAGGVVTDWGNHDVDIAHWGADCELTGPVSVEARALFPNPEGPEYYNVPNRFFSRMLYPNGVEMLFFTSTSERKRLRDTSSLYAKFPPVESPFADKRENVSPEQLDWLFGKDVPQEIKAYNRTGIMFIGEKGRVFVNGGGVYGKPVEELKGSPLPSGARRAYPSNDHTGNFIECVKTRKQPCAPVQIEHRTVTACHLTNISLRLKRKITWDPVAQQIVGDEEAGAMQKRQQRAPYLVTA